MFFDRFSSASLAIFILYYLQRLRCAHSRVLQLVLFVNTHFVTNRTSLEAAQTRVRRPAITPKAGTRRTFRLEISLRGKKYNWM